MKPFNQTLIAMGLSASALLASSCGNQESTSELDIVNGLVIPYEEEPSVVFLYNPAEEGEGGGVCTGTFVKKNVVLTAAHCTDYVDNQSIRGANEELGDKMLIIDWDETIDTDDDPSNGISGGFYLVAESSRIFRHPNINSRNIKTVTTNDLALIYFDEYESVETKDIAASAPSRGESATIIGFGADRTRPAADDTSVGIKRKGSISINGVSGFITFRGPNSTSCTTNCGENSNSGPGDSGGPMIVDGEVVGVTSGGSFFSSSYVNVNSSGSRNFIDSIETELGFSIN